MNSTFSSSCSSESQQAGGSWKHLSSLWGYQYSSKLKMKILSFVLSDLLLHQEDDPISPNVCWLCPADVGTLMVKKEELPPEQQERSPHPDQGCVSFALNSILPSSTCVVHLRLSPSPQRWWERGGNEERIEEMRRFVLRQMTRPFLCFMAWGLLVMTASADQDHHSALTAVCVSAHVLQ